MQVEEPVQGRRRLQPLDLAVAHLDSGLKTLDLSLLRDFLRLWRGTFRVRDLVGRLVAALRRGRMVEAGALVLRQSLAPRLDCIAVVGAPKQMVAGRLVEVARPRALVEQSWSPMSSVIASSPARTRTGFWRGCGRSEAT